jgi:hypothetical protein
MTTNADLILGLDAGTSVVKAALFDREGRELAVVRRPTPLYTPQPSWSETSMQATWSMAAEAMRALLARGAGATPIDPSRIAAVGLTGNMVGAWLVDAGGEPVRDAILWNDGRAQDLIDRLSGEHPGFMQTIFRTSGSVMQQGCTLPVLRWLADHEPGTLRRAATVLCCKDWIAYKLTGSRQVDPTEASVMPGSAGGRGYRKPSPAICTLRLRARRGCWKARRSSSGPATCPPPPSALGQSSRVWPARCSAPTSSTAWSPRRRSTNPMTSVSCSACRSNAGCGR